MESISEFVGENVAKVGLSVAIVVVIFLLRLIILRTLGAKLESGESVFRFRKSSVYVATALAGVSLVSIWLSELGSFGSVIGIISAGIAIALTDVIKNLAGWVYLMLRRPFKAGDRIEIGPHAGDVIDIRLFRFSLLEIRNWVDADQSTGRIVHIPNGMSQIRPPASPRGFPSSGMKCG